MFKGINIYSQEKLFKLNFSETMKLQQTISREQASKHNAARASDALLCRIVFL